MLTLLSDSVIFGGMSETRWTLNKLTEQVEAALAVDYVPASSARVRARPDARTIRYYTTLGLVDRPIDFRGRTALYARRHLLQLVAIKRLQADGLSLAEIQARLTGLDDAALAAAAAPSGRPAKAPAAETNATPRSRRQSDFWTAAPTDAQDAAPKAPAPAPASAPVRPSGPAPSASAAAALAGVQLPGGVTLLLPSPRSLSDDDLRAVAAAAALIETLTRRGLVASL